MRRFAKSSVLALALALSLSVGAGVTSDAAKKVTVKKVASVDKVTGKKKITLTKGKKATLKTTVTVTPNKAANKKVTYKTSNKKIATVSSKGVITAKKAGKATITVASKKNSKKKAKVAVTVVTGKVKKVTANKTATTLKVGATEKLSATVKTSGKKANKTLKWTSSNKSVATVGSAGKVTAVAPGTATITVKSTDGTNKKATVTVTVENYKTVVSPVDKKDVAVEVEFKDATKAQNDINKVAKFSNDKEVLVNIDGKDYVAKVENDVVKINGKELKDSDKAKNAKKVTVKTQIKADKIATITAFAPESVQSIKIGTVTFTDVTATSFKVGTTTYNYVVNGKTIEVTGDAKAVLAGLGDVVTIEVK